MKTTLLLIGLIAVVSLSSFKGEKNSDAKAKAEMATTNLAGVIVDELSGETLVGVEVSIDGTDLKAYTDFDGNFTFNNIAAGKYSISAKLISYKEIKGKQIEAGVNKNQVSELKMDLNN